MEVENGETKVENKVIRRFLRVLAGLAIVFVLVVGAMSKLLTGSWNLTAGDYAVAGISFGVLLTIEGVRAYVKRKLEK